MSGAIYISKSGARSAPKLPADAVTRTFGIFGQRGTGKTTSARVLAEGMVKVGGHVVVLDPVGVWWGITRAGEGPGLPGIVVGGEHGDVPLEETGGQLVADLVMGRHWPVVVIDLKLLRKGAQLRFLADFLEAVFHGNRAPLHVVFEEADRALPQTPRGMDPTLGRVLGAAEDIVKLGRSRGLAATLVSQRFATVAKNVVEQVDALLLHRMLGPNDRKAVKGWIESNGDPAVTARVLDSMAALGQGEAWLYAPGWLGLLERLRMRAPKTFDSSATPEVGSAAAEPSTKRAPVDLGELRRQMAETVERAKANDPKALRERLAELERQLAERPAAEPERVAVPFVPDEVRRGLVWLRDELREAAECVEGLLDGLPPADAALPMPAPRETARDLRTPVGDGLAVKPLGHAPPAERNGNGGGMSEGARRLVADLAFYFPLWLDRGQLALLLGRGKRSSTLTQQLAEAVQAGALEAERGRYRVAEATRAGRRSAPTLDELRQMFRDALPDGPRALFDVLVDAGGGSVPRESLFKRAGFSPTSSTPVTHLKLLRDNGLAEVERGYATLGPAVR